MAIVITALLPVFVLIVLGAVLKRTLMRLDTQWHGTVMRTSEPPH
jgi:malonate transporter and related proteins